MTTPQQGSTRLLGIDYGSKRVGVAISDERRTIATPVTTIIHTSLLLAEIGKIASEYGTKEIILGESRNYQNEANTIMADILTFKSSLEAAGYAVHFEPEFMSSIQAERIQGKNALSDASAAALILQSYLDRTVTSENVLL